MSRSTFRWIGLAVACLLAVAACSGGGKAKSAPATTTSSTTTTAPPPTTTTAPPPPPTWPLLGFPTDPASMVRPILAVKIDNVAVAHPQSGINQADVVYEEMVENSSTRLLALFQSTDVAPIGPVRSARPTDVLIFTNLHRPMFAWSGANPWVTDMINESNIVDVGNTPAVDQYYRDNSRRAPDNLYIQGYFSMVTSHQNDAGVPKPVFLYRTPTDPLGAGARPVINVNITWGPFGGNAPVDYAWDASIGGFKRWQNGEPHVDTDGVQVAPPNVIIQFVNYNENGGIPDGQLLGLGKAWILTAGNIIDGFWVKTAPDARTLFFDSAHMPIKLTPGRTWVTLAQPDTATATLTQ